MSPGVALGGRGARQLKKAGPGDHGGTITLISCVLSFLEEKLRNPDLFL